MALASNAPKTHSTAWKHIGLYGHSVGTFTADPAAIQWKSAALDDDNVYTTRLLPGRSLTSSLWTVFGHSGHLRIQSKKETSKDKYQTQELRFDGFPPSDFEKLRSTLKKLYNVDLIKHTMSSSGCSFGNMDISGRHLVFRQCIVDEEGEEGQDGDEMLTLDMAEVSQCVLPGNTRNEIELQFHESDTVEQGTDQLVQIRIYVAPDQDADPTDPDASTAAEILQQRIMTKANIKNTTGNVIAEFDDNKGTFLTPRGRYTIELYDSFLRMRGNKYDYKIKYDDISRLFLLPKPDDVHMAFVIALDRPIRQGQQRYQYLVLQTNKEQSEIAISLDQETLQREYNGDLQPVMQGSFSNLIAKTFKVITRKKVFVPGKFANSSQQACVKCALRANEGHLYPLEKQFIFIHKPSVLIRFDEIESVEFQRYAGGQGSTRNFDLCVTLLDSQGDSTKEYIFSGIDRSDYAALYSFLSGKKIRIKAQDGGIEEPVRQVIYNEDVIYGTAGKAEGEMPESSEDEDYEAPGQESESESMSDSDDDEDLGDGSDDSDLEEARQKARKEKKKQEKEGKKEKDEEESKASSKASGKIEKKKRKKPSLDSSSVGSDKKKRKIVSKEEVKKKKSKSDDASASVKSKKAKKDPNAPKKNLTSFMIFSNAKRAEIKEKNPDASFGDIAKLVGAEFKKLSDEERKKFGDLAEKDKARYLNEMKDYKPPTEESGSESDDDSPKKGKKDPNAPKKGLSAYNFFFRGKRDEIKKNNPSASFGEISKLIGAEFKSLSSEERKKWQDMAKKDKNRYEQEMEDYSPQKGEKNKKVKKKKDPNAPKKNLTSYMLFMQAMRPKVKNDNPDASFGELGKLVGEEFKKLSPDERKKWDEKADADKKRYQKEMKEYETKKKEEQEDSSSDDGDEDDDEEKGNDDDSSSAASDSGSEEDSDEDTDSE